MGETEIFIHQTKEAAEEEFKFWQSISEVTVLLISPADVVSMRGVAPDLIRWESGKDRDWHVVIATRAKDIVADKAISQAA